MAPDQLTKREALRRCYERGRSIRDARAISGVADGTARHWYHRWIREDGDKAPLCACGRSLIHSGRCWARTKGPARRWPVYTGPAVIGRAMSEAEVASFRAKEARHGAQIDAKVGGASKSR